MIELEVNGEKMRFNAPLNVEGLVKKLGLDPEKIAIECNLEIIPASHYMTRWLETGNRLEIVHFIGGG